MEKTIQALDNLIAFYLDTIVSFFQFDIMVFSQWWLYAPFFIPCVFYMMFFFLKWTILFSPIWLPLRLILHKQPFKSKS